MDALCVINALWPLIVLTGVLFPNRFRLSSTFLVLGTAHRWVTLPLVALDWNVVRARRHAVILGCLGVVALFTGLQLAGVAFGTLGIVVMIYDSWHRGGQHFGMVRMYERGLRAWGGVPRPIERQLAPHLVRGLVVYTFLRGLGVGSLGGGHWVYAHFAGSWTRIADVFALVVAGFALVETLASAATLPAEDRARALPRTLYVTSTVAIYIALLVAVWLGARVWATAVIGAAIAFHAVEYLTITSQRVRGRASALHGWRRVVANGWLPLLVAILGAFTLVTWLMPQRWITTWFGLNALVSLLHFQLDGSIWKRASNPA